jgi:hypothetical protein
VSISLCSPELDECRWCLCGRGHECSGILSASYGPALCTLTSHHNTVSRKMLGLVMGLY